MCSTSGPNPPLFVHARLNLVPPPAVQTERTQVLPGIGGYYHGKDRHKIKR